MTTRAGSRDRVVTMMRRTAYLLPFVWLLAMRSLAHATPPDPTWIEGWYDAADLDDILRDVLLAKALVVPPPPIVGRPGRLVGAEVPLLAPTSYSSPVVAAGHPRAPPPR